MICVLPIRHQRCRFPGSAGSKGSSSEEEHRGGSGAERRSGSAERIGGAAERGGGGKRSPGGAQGPRPPTAPRQPALARFRAGTGAVQLPPTCFSIAFPPTDRRVWDDVPQSRPLQASPARGPWRGELPRSTQPATPGSPARHPGPAPPPFRRLSSQAASLSSGSVGRESHYAHTSAAPAGSPPRGWEQPWRAGERHHAAAAPHPPRSEWWAKPSPTVSVPGKRRARTFAISSSRAGGRSPRRRRRGPWLGSRGIAPCRSSRGA